MNNPVWHTQAFQKNWLKLTATVVTLFGPVFLLGSFLPTAEPARVMMDILGWTLDGGQSFDARTTRFLSALCGGFLIGWGLTIWLLSGAVHDAAPNAVRKAVVVGLVAWFITDSLASIASGHPSNAGFNLFFLILSVGPLWWAPVKSEQLV